MSRVRIVPSNGKQISKTILAVRELSLREIEMLDACENLSYKSWLGYDDKRLVCSWGIIPPSLLAEEAYMWLYTIPEIKENSFLFVRHSQKFIEEIRKEYTIIGHVKPSEESSKKWLKWLGATFGRHLDRDMIPFRIERKWQTQ